MIGFVVSSGSGVGVWKPLNRPRTTKRGAVVCSVSTERKVMPYEKSLLPIGCVDSIVNFDEFFMTMFEKHGSLFAFKHPMFGEMVAIAGDDAFIEFSVAAEGRGELTNKDKLLAPMMEMLGQDNMVALDGKEHRNMRRLLSPGLSKSTIAKMATKVDTIMTAKLETLAAEAASSGETINGYDLAKDIAYEVMLDCLVPSIPHEEGMQLYGWFKEFASGMLSLGVKLPGTRYSKGIAARDNLREALKEYVRQRRNEMENLAEEDVEQDTLSMMILAQDDDGIGMDDENVAKHMVNNMFGGFETNGSTMGRIVQVFAERKNDEAIAKLHDSISSAESGPLLKAMMENIYLRNFLAEIYRMYPAAVGLQRKIAKDVDYDGYLLPAGKVLFVSFLKSNFDPKKYEEPEKLIPERWLDSTTPPLTANTNFGYGVHRCLGKHFADLVNLSFIKSMSELTQKYEFTLAEGQDLSRDSFSVVNIAVSGVLVNIRRKAD